jgi:6-phosphogluconolactonase (cycloisomerase 2 family)
MPDGAPGVHGIHSASSVQVSPDGGTVYARGTDATLAVFHRDPASGKLAFFQLEQNGVAGLTGLAGGDISCAVSPDSRNVYANGSNDSALVVFTPEPGRGLAAVAVLTLAVLACMCRRVEGP